MKSWHRPSEQPRNDLELACPSRHQPNKANNITARAQAIFHLSLLVNVGPPANRLSTIYSLSLPRMRSVAIMSPSDDISTKIFSLPQWKLVNRNTVNTRIISRTTTDANTRVSLMWLRGFQNETENTALYEECSKQHQCKHR